MRNTLDNPLKIKIYEELFLLESSPAARSFNPQSRLYHHWINKNSPEKKSQQAFFDSTNATGIRLTCLLLIISFTFVLCTLPVSINALIAKILPEYRSTTRWQITQLCLTLFMYFNHTVSENSIFSSR